MTTAQLITWRHSLHEIAETAFNEHKTAEYIAEQLRLLGLEVTTGIGGTGVIGTLTRGSGKKTIGLRADLDGLPLLEKSAVSYKSKNDGAMHACGHDGHMTMVLGAAAELINDTSINGTVHFLFQPAEEPGLGAQAMIDDGLFERFPMDEIHGIHNVPGSPAGHLLTREGPLMASEDNFVITITGRGGHASRPQMLIDPLVIGSEIVLALQTIVSRSVDPDLSAVVSCTEFISDGSRNAVPSEVIIKGDTRTFELSVSSLIETRMREICAGIASSYGALV
jgi:hippurate hydrolase